MNVRDIKIEDINIIENVRLTARDSSMQELMASIKQVGLLEPIGVVPSTTDKNKYNLKFGNRRMVACEKLGWKTIPAVVGETIDLKDHIILNITENLQRRDPSPMELGRACMRLKDEMDMTDGEIAERLGVSKNRIQQAMEVFTKIPANHRKKVRFMPASGSTKNGHIPASSISKLLSIKRHQGMTDTAFDKLLTETRTQELSAPEINIMSRLIGSGCTVQQAIAARKKFHAYPVEVVLDNEEAEAMCAKYKVDSVIELVRQIIYGLVPTGFKKPDFIKINQPVAIPK